MQDYIKFYSKRHPNVILRAFPGHFVTPNSHINYYIDMTSMKARTKEAQAVAKALSEDYAATTMVDTIVCMDGMEMIGGFVAENLEKAGILSINQHKTIYVIPPEYTSSGQMLFRENTIPMIKDRHVLLILASATTGDTISKAVESIIYYGGKVSGVSTIFSAVSKIAGMPVHSLFTTSDLPDYRNYSPHDCALCRNAVKIDALCNSFGFSKLV